MEKKCKYCGETHSVNFFDKHPRNKDGRSSKCRSCTRTYYNNRYVRKIPKREIKYKVGTREYNKDAYLWSVYKITLDDYNSKLEEQNFCCAICGLPSEESRVDLSVDHDHSTGKVRGLLCNNCNNGIGKFFENEELFLSAIKYLKKYR